MIKIEKVKKYLAYVIFMLVIVVISAGINFYLNYPQDEEFSIDPQAKLDPQKEYKIVYWDYPLLWGIEGDYEDFLQTSIQEFQQNYPNIKVEYKFLSPLQGRKKLEDSLEQGSPPDIYNAILGNKLFASKLQLPIDLLISKEELKRYSSAALDSFSAQDKIWGLPHLIIPQLWVGNESILKRTKLNLSEVYEQGWSWQEFSQTASQIANLEPQRYIIFNPQQEKLLYQLASTVEAETTTETGEFNQVLLSNSFKLLNNLKENKVFPKEEAKMSEKFLASFWQGQVGIIAPVTPWLLNSIYQQNKRYPKVELTLLPVPMQVKKEKVLIETAGLVLFRQQEYKGDDHSKAVYKFAKFINQKQSLYLSSKLKVPPAYLPNYDAWQEKTELNNKSKDLLLNYAQQGRAYVLFRADNSSLKVQQKIKQEYQKFWSEND